MNRKELGKKAEEMAADEMKKRGCHILKRNYYCPLGEIDLIYRDGNVLVFAEVKYRSTLHHGWPEDAVDARKQRRIKRVAQWYMLNEHEPFDQSCRFDVIAIAGTVIKVYQNAFA